MYFLYVYKNVYLNIYVVNIWLLFTYKSNIFSNNNCDSFIFTRHNWKPKSILLRHAWNNIVFPIQSPINNLFNKLAPLWFIYTYFQLPLLAYGTTKFSFPWFVVLPEQRKILWNSAPPWHFPRQLIIWKINCILKFNERSEQISLWNFLDAWSESFRRPHLCRGCIFLPYSKKFV